MIKLICVVIIGICAIVMAISSFTSFCKIEENHREMEKLRREAFSDHEDQKRR